MTENSLLAIFIYSLIQGITEFIPVSSSAHLNIIENFINNSEKRNLLFETTAHMSTILALLLYLVRHSESSLKDLFLNNYKLIVISMIPALIVGFLFKMFDVNFFSLKIIAVTSIIGAIMLFGADKLNKIKMTINSPLVEFSIAGLFQCLAFLPGFSRSGSCITAFLLLGKKKEQAINNSLLMSFPIIILSFLSNIKDINTIEINLDLVLIFVISFLSAYFTLFFFIKYINKIGFTPYIIYRIFLGLMILFYLN
jgi:undecaprenyl-diphosphatase|tara:strand:- start:223 stop:984 length:762 start_codon:yes stop_codon:yes gene_type:complete